MNLPPAKPIPPDLSEDLDPWAPGEPWHGDDGVLAEVLVSECDLSEVVPKRALDLTSFRAVAVQLIGGKFAHSQLTNVSLERCSLAGSQFEGSRWQRVEISGAQLSGVQLSDSGLKDVVFSECKLDYANFRFARLQRVMFIDCELVECDFANAQLSNVTIERCNVRAVDFSNAKFANSLIAGSDMSQAKGLTSLKGCSVPWVDVVQMAGALAVSVGIKVVVDQQDA